MKALQKFLIKSGIENVDALLNKFLLFSGELQKANKTVNLTAITEPHEIEVKHFIDSLSGLEFIQGEVLDIGAGAGFPSIPLALVKEDVRITMAESVGKKTEFLRAVCTTLELRNVRIIHSRIEDLDKSVLYDTVVARALGALNIICEYALPFLKVGGLFIAYKAQKAQEELAAAQNALRILGGAVEDVVPYECIFNGERHERNLVLIRKISTGIDDGKYPRGQNKPRLKPL
ncbi:MAG: 16S rRNA (guanine(527)-N(7))-methyltransferase RsmG [Firmicutes bacterium]|nr:16S rRNA (guanine(527)-N(7))-methyltransferase RsmG [Bacillota bacterium]